MNEWQEKAMAIEEYWDNLTQSEKFTFQRTSRYLLKQTFIVRDKDDNSRKLYNFVSRNADFFIDYFAYTGFEVLIDRENGVAMLSNRGSKDDSEEVQTNHLRLRKIDSIILCALWTLYADRMREGILSRTCQISVADLSFALEKFGYKDTLDKTTLKDTLTTLARYNLVHVEGNVGEPDCLIVMYPSLQFTLNKEEFQNFAEHSALRMKKTKGGEDIESLEQDDSDEEES